MESKFQRIGALHLGAWFRDFLRPRYLALEISLFLAMYVGLRFALVLFNAADVGERWSFELTPFVALNLPDVQLGFLSSVAAVSNAFLHYSVKRTHRLWAIVLTGIMVAGLLLALRTAPADLDPVNSGRVAALVLLLALVPLDNADLLRMGRRPPEDFIETELRSIAQTHAAADSVNPAAVTRALQELETLVMGFPETEPVAEPPPSPAATPEDEYLRDLMTSLLGESTSDEKLPKPAKPSVRESKSGSVPPSREPVLEDDEDEWEEPVAVPRRWFARSPADFLEEARALLDKGEPEKAMQRLDRVAAQDLRYPGLWDLAAEAFERMGEPEMAAKCRRRAQESTR